MIDLPILPADATAATVTLATSRLASLHAYLRRAAAASDHGTPFVLRPAVRAYRVIDATLPAAIHLAPGDERVESGAGDRHVRERHWCALDAVVFPASGVEELRQRAARLTAPIGGTLRADRVLARLADALALGWAPYADDLWPAAAAELARCTRWWDGAVAPRSAATIAALRRALGIGDAVPIPRVLVVPAAAWPGGAAYPTPAGPLVVVDGGRHRGAELVEAVFDAVAGALGMHGDAAPADADGASVRGAIGALVATVTGEARPALGRWRAEAGAATRSPGVP